jgi:hypothetical protein
VVVAVDETQDLGRVAGGGVHDSGGQLTHQQRGGRAVAVVQLVAHLQGLRDQRREVQRSQLVQGGPHHGAEHLAHPAQPLQHLGAVGAVPQYLAQTFVERAVGGAAVLGVTDLEHPHRRGDDARHGADGPVMVAGVQPRLPGGQPLPGLLGVGGQPLQQHRPDERATHRARRPFPVDRRSGVQERALRQVEHLVRRPYPDELGPRGQQAAHGGLVGTGPARIGQHTGQIIVGAGHRRTPVHPHPGYGLRVQRLAEHVGADSDHFRLAGEHGQRHRRLLSGER